MALTDYKITDANIAAKGVVAAPDKLTGTAAQNKAVFDRLIREVIKDDFNNLIMLLAGFSGASEIGFTALSGLPQENVQGAIGQIKAIADSKADNALTEAALALKSDIATTNRHIKAIAFDSASGVFTFTREDGTTISFDTALEKVATNWEYINTAEHPQSLKLTLADGAYQYISLSAFIDESEFVDSPEIDFIVTDHKVAARIKSGSITDTMLASSLVQQLQNYVSGAASSATSAYASENNALAYKNAAELAKTAAESSNLFAQAAKESASASSSSAAGAAEQAAESNNAASIMATLSGQYAVGPTKQQSEDFGTPTDTNNARYYMEQAALYALGENGMKKTDYDSDDSVATAGGIKPYIESLNINKAVAKSGDANTYFPNEKWKIEQYACDDTTTTNLPSSDLTKSYIVISEVWFEQWAYQIAIDITTNVVFKRFRDGTGNISPWEELALGSQYVPRNGEASIDIHNSLHIKNPHGITTRHIDGNSTEFDGSLFLNYGNNAPIKLGQNGGGEISGDGLNYSGVAARAALSQAVAPASYEARATALFPTEVTPTIEGAIAWQYE